MAPSPVYDARLPKAIGPYWNDRLWVSLEWGPLDADNADTKNFLDVMKAYGSSEPDSLSQGGYLAARVATNALLSLKGNIDRASMTAAVQQEQNFKNDMFCTPWAFGPKDATARLGNRSAWIAQIHDGGWKINDQCVVLSDAEVAP
jgi:branched-chain amino acid transport system substrate-binding protein